MYQIMYKIVVIGHCVFPRRQFRGGANVHFPLVITIAMVQT